ncbi:MAG: holo-ACP synthase [Francisellaceae bacterium]|jgi:holo-[acyl-carrier protein] synthase|nr:holo-ACP synthase [Francisellaceae bacterium]MBT6207831.1 holo-ACP synthase [Francisellaceae bacterium]MBT6539043.1 holo-ACP synthase [Francisellaceae bacterium]
MSIYGVGVDLVNIDRVRKVWDKYGIKFANRILSELEKERLKNVKDSALFIAKCFAVKEAVAKSLGVGFRNDVFLTNISYTQNELKKPIIQYHGVTLDFVIRENITTTHISVADEPPQVLAYAISEITT